MKFAFYFLLFTQIFNFLGVFAEKIKKDSSEVNLIKWEKVKKNKYKPQENIIWKSYKGDENYFKNKNENSFKFVGDNASSMESQTWRNRIFFSGSKVSSLDIHGFDWIWRRTFKTTKQNGNFGTNDTRRRNKYSYV